MRTKRKGLAPRLLNKVIKSSITTVTRGIRTYRNSTGKTNKCLACGSCFTTKSKLMDHNCVKVKGDKKCVESTSHPVSLAPVALQTKSRQRSNNMRLQLLTCSLCEENFNADVDFKNHLLTHTHSVDGKMYICNVCKQMFETIDEWKAHIKLSANASHCDQCGQNFGCVTAKTSHECFVPTLFPCLECKASFKKKWVLKRHVLYQHTSFPCNICKKVLPSRCIYKEHVLIHKDVKLISPNKKNRFVEKKNLPKKRKRETSSKRETRSSIDHSKQKDELGLKMTNDPSVADDHYSSANSVYKKLDTVLSKAGKVNKSSGCISLPSCSRKSRTCDTCHKMFRSFKQLKLHIRFKCGKLSQSVQKPATSCLQQKTVSPGQRKSSLANSNLENELLSMKNFKCRSCPKTYRSQKQLQLHKKVHKLAKLQISCEKCGRQFWSKSHYAGHLQLHARKQLKCDVCFTGMPTLAQLRIHRATHFAAVHGTTRRESKTSPGKHVYDCNHCHEVFSSLMDFEDHCRVLNLHSDTVNVHFNGKVVDSTSCSAESCAKMVISDNTVVEPTEAAGLPEEAKECRDVKHDSMKVKRNSEHANLANERSEDNCSSIVATDSYNFLREESNKFEGTLTSEHDSQSKHGLSVTEKEEKFVNSTNVCTHHPEDDAADLTLNLSNAGIIQENIVLNIFETSSAPNSSMLRNQKNSYERKLNYKQQFTSSVSPGEFFPHRNGSIGDKEVAEVIGGHDVEESSLHATQTLLVDNKSQVENIQSESSNLTISSCNSVETPTSSIEKRSKFSPIAKGLVSVYVKQLIQDGISELSPHVCSFCGKVFLKPQGINNHYLMKHTLQEIEALSSGLQHRNDIKMHTINDLTSGKCANNTTVCTFLEYASVIYPSDEVKSDLSSMVVETEKTLGHGNTSQQTNTISEDKSEQSICQQSNQQMPQSLTCNSAAFAEKIVSSDNSCFTKSSQEESLLANLRVDFSKLFCHLVGDNQVLSDLGWPHRLIDDVLFDTITLCDQKPSYQNCKLASFRENICTLLKICIKEQAMETFGWETKLVDNVVKEMLTGGGIKY